MGGPDSTCYLERNAWSFRKTKKWRIQVGVVWPGSQAATLGANSGHFDSSRPGLLAVGSVGLPRGYRPRDRLPPPPRGWLAVMGWPALMCRGPRTGGGGWLKVTATAGQPDPAQVSACAAPLPPFASPSPHEKQLAFMLWAVGNSLCSSWSWKSGLNPE